MAGGASAFDSRRDHQQNHRTNMNPNEQSCLIGIMADVLAELQGMRQEQVETNRRLDRLEKRTEQNTAAIGELRLSVVRLADRMEEFVDLSKRVQRLEAKVFT